MLQEMLVYVSPILASRRIALHRPFESATFVYDTLASLNGLITVSDVHESIKTNMETGVRSMYSISYFMVFLTSAYRDSNSYCY